MIKFNNLSDDELMAKIALGNDHAFKTLFDRHAGKFLGYASRLLNDQMVAEDMTQEVWVKVVTLSPSYQANGHFIAWSFTMIRNRCLNWIRSNKKWLQSTNIDGPEGQEISSDVELESDFIRKHDKASVWREINQLPASQRLALTTWLAEGCSYEEIASSMNLSVSAIKSLLFRAKKQLEITLGESL